MPAPLGAAHSHSIIFGFRNTLMLRRKICRHTVEHRQANSSKIYTFDFAREFPRLEICSVSATIGISRSIFGFFGEKSVIGLAKKDRHPWRRSRAATARR